MSGWVNHAIESIDADFHRSSDTHLIRLDLPALDHVQLCLKDESLTEFRETGRWPAIV